MFQVPQIEIEEQVVEVPVAKQVQVPMIQKVQKMVDVLRSNMKIRRHGTQGAPGTS